MYHLREDIKELIVRQNITREEIEEMYKDGSDWYTLDDVLEIYDELIEEYR